MTTAIETHRDLRVWQEAMTLAEITYGATAKFPSSETFGLALQMRRAVVSVISNIAEGAARNSPKDFAKYLAIARGSLAELDAQSELAARLQILRQGQQLRKQCETCGRLLSALSSSIRRKIPQD